MSALAVTALELRVAVVAEAPLPTRAGPLRMLVFRHRSTPEVDHVAMIAGDPRGDSVLARVHSECMTGEVFGSLKCDCAEQLDRSLRAIAQLGRGVVVYLRQEGRGIGLARKVQGYALQARGVDTVDANRALGLPDDARSYTAAADLLRHLGVRGVRLLTNNPEKVYALEGMGIVVEERVPIVVAANPHSAGYLETKRARMNHWLPRAPAPSAPAATPSGR